MVDGTVGSARSISPVTAALSVHLAHVGTNDRVHASRAYPSENQRPGMHAHTVDPRSRRHSHGRLAMVLSVDLASFSVLYQYSISTSSARRRKGSMPSWIRSYLGHAQVRHQAKGSILRLVLLCLAQTPALAQSTANGTANATAECRCTNVCTGAPQYAVDDECDDGGPGAGYDLCEYGSECLDCGGPR